MANSKRQCRNCKERFKTETGRIVGTAFYCSIDCQVKYGTSHMLKGKNKLEAERNKKHAHQKRNFRLNDKSLRTKAADKYFNRYIRLRDDKEPCISCQRHHSGQYHAGHYQPKGQNSALRYNELNVNKQCAPCNNKKSGNLTEYRINLINKIGLEAVEELEQNTEIHRVTCEELKAIEIIYKQKCKELTEGLTA